MTAHCANNRPSFDTIISIQPEQLRIEILSDTRSDSDKELRPQPAIETTMSMPRSSPTKALPRSTLLVIRYTQPASHLANTMGVSLSSIRRVLFQFKINPRPTMSAQVGKRPDAPLRPTCVTKARKWTRYTRCLQPTEGSCRSPV
jgi:hypothetical protein